MKWIIIGLCIVTALQAWMIGTYRRQMKNICRQLSFLMKKDSNMLLTGDVRIGGIGKLLDTLNDYLLVQRKKRDTIRKRKRRLPTLIPVYPMIFEPHLLLWMAIFNYWKPATQRRSKRNILRLFKIELKA